MFYRLFLSVFCISAVCPCVSNAKDLYAFYDIEGKSVGYSEIIDDIASCDFFFFGELHNNPVSHWLEFEITEDLYKAQKDIVLGAEFFEADNQLVIDEYFSGIIDEKRFEENMRLWPNYLTDYKPVVTFAREKGINFIATNIPRRYASFVNYRGLDSLNSLSDEAKKYIPPLPVLFDRDLPCYKKISETSMGKKLENMIGSEKKLYLAEAQAVKDAAMAYNCVENRREGELFIHFNGSYHSDNHESIIWYINKQLPGVRIKTLSTVLQSDVGSLEAQYLGRGDYIVAVDENAATTY